MFVHESVGYVWPFICNTGFDEASVDVIKAHRRGQIVYGIVRTSSFHSNVDL